MSLHAGLEKGNAVEAGTREYFRDSFRRQVLVPSFKSVKEELKANRKNDVIAEGILTVVTLILLGGIIMLWSRIRNLKHLYLQQSTKDRV